MREDHSRTEERLLTREQIDDLTDLESLEALLDDVTAAAKAIAVDLEFRSDDAADDHWEHRARKSLTAHYVCQGHLTRRIKFLRRGGKPVKQSDDGSKARRREAEAQRLLAQAENKRLRAAEDREKTVRTMVAYAARQSLLAHFHRAASKHLDQATMAQLMGEAHRGHLAMMAADLPASVGRNPQGHDPQGHGAEHEHAVPAEQGDAQ